MEGEGDLLKEVSLPPPNLPLPPRTSRKSPPVQSGNLTRFDGRRGLAGSSFSGREVRCGGWCGFALRLWGNVPDVLYMTVVSKNPQGILRIFWDSAKRMLPAKERFTNIQNSEPYVRTSPKNALEVLEGVLGGTSSKKYPLTRPLTHP